MRQLVFRLFIAGCAATALSGCAAVVAAGALGAGVVASQERSALDAYDDMTVQANLNTRMMQNHDARTFANVNTKVMEGRVLLTGVVASESERAELERLAEDTPGVGQVMNHVEVGSGSMLSGLPDDAWLSTQLNAKLLGDAKIKNQNYETVTQSGVIYIVGIAQDDAERRRVVEHARSLGPREVVDYIVLKDDPDRYGRQAAYDGS